MKTIRHIFALLALVMLLGACSSEQTTTKTQVKSDWRGRAEAYSVSKDKDGNPVMKSDRRSSMEGKESNIASSRDFQGKDYTRKSYRKKRWFGSTFLGKKKYQGNTDASSFKREPWFVKKQANASGKVAHAAGKSFSINPFSTSTAHEQSRRGIARPADAETNVRRRVFKQPDITHWKKQGDLSVGDTNRLLRR